MKTGRSTLAVAAATALVLITGGVVFINREFLFNPYTDVSIQPRFVSPPGEAGDPRVIGVGFTWNEQGYCAEQFRTSAVETSTQVRIRAVISRTSSGGVCPGIGTDGKLASADLTLARPIGGREVVRDSDGAALPVFALGTRLACQDVIASAASPPADLPVVLNEVGMPTVRALQASPSGETDPNARLFAKQGLLMVSGASFELSVPDEWLGRLTIGWGIPATRSANIYVSGCSTTPSQALWLVFAGGFWVNEPACVPIVVRTRSSEQTVQVGVGAPCPGQAPPLQN